MKGNRWQTASILFTNVSQRVRVCDIAPSLPPKNGRINLTLSLSMARRRSNTNALEAKNRFGTFSSLPITNLLMLSFSREERLPDHSSDRELTTGCGFPEALLMPEFSC
jgi:hypothetical protein